MARSEEFQSGSGKIPIYHGTDQEFKPGDIIYPSTHPKHPDGDYNASMRDDEVDRDLEDHFSDRDPEDDRDDDEIRADYKDYAALHWDHAWATPGLENARGYGGKNGGRVYQVEHLSPESCETCFYNKQGHSMGGDHTDDSGYRVIKEV